MESSTELLQSIDPPLPRAAWPDPTPEMIESNGFGPIWDCIKSWDIGIPGVYTGYSGATGNHVRAIMDALWARGFKIVPIENAA
jgi:hypothetical protein